MSMSCRRPIQRSIVLVVALLIALATTPVATAQNEPRYFAETGHYLRGAFRSFWERHGGLAIFGYPITEEYVRRSDGRIIQYFERARFELRVQGNQAIVDLGLLGVEATGNRIFPQSPPVNSTSTLRYFPETGHTLRGAFKTFWERRGGLAIFGYPISEEFSEQFGDGRWRTVQYFQRARFELWPGGVRLGLLGRQLAPSQLLASWPPNNPPPGPLSEDGTPRPPPFPTPTPVPPPPAPGDPSKLGQLIHDGLGVRGNGSIVPLAAPPGYSFIFRSGGYDPAESVSVWLTRPAGGGVEAVDPRLVERDGHGNITVVFNTAQPSEGVWTVTGQGVVTGRSVTAPFIITRDFVAPLGTLRPGNRNGATAPHEGGQRTTFHFTASGFKAHETIEHWITSPAGVYYLAGTLRADSRGRIGYNPSLRVRFRATDPTGVYGYHYRGTHSGARADLYVTYTGRP